MLAIALNQAGLRRASAKGADPEPASLPGVQASISVTRRVLRGTLFDVLFCVGVAVGLVAMAMDAGSTEYSYDAQGRLQAVTYRSSDAALRQNYAYDEYGNRVVLSMRPVNGLRGEAGLSQLDAIGTERSPLAMPTSSNTVP